jgi:phage pi2 protein 07
VVAGKKEDVEHHLSILNPDLIPRGGHANAGVVYWPDGSVEHFTTWLHQHFEELAEWAATKRPELAALPYGGYDQCVLNVYGIDSGRRLRRLDCHFNYHLSQFRPELRWKRGGLIHYHHNNKALLLEDAATLAR